MDLIGINDIWDWILDNLSWKKVEEMFPGGKGVYNLFEIDLSKARTNKKYTFYGDRLIVQQIDSDVQMRLNHCENDLIDLNIVRNIRTPFKEFYITNEAKSGFLKILAGGGGMFEAKQEIRNPSDVFGRLFDISNDELAARLGSPFVYDRRGDVFWYDDFGAAVLHWNDESSGVGAVASLNTSDAYTGEQSCRLDTGGVANNYGMIQHYFDLPSSSGLGFEFTITGQYLTGTFEFMVTLLDGTYISHAKIKYVGSDHELFYLDDTETYQSLGTVSPFGIAPLNYTTIKLVIDYKKQKYVRLLKGITTFDLSNYDMHKTASAADASMFIQLKLTTLNTQPKMCCINDVLVTQNEP